LSKNEWLCVIDDSRGRRKRRRRRGGQVMPSQPIPRHHSDAVFLPPPPSSSFRNKGSIFLFGGLSQRNEEMNDLWMWDLTRNYWENVVTMGVPPSPR